MSEQDFDDLLERVNDAVTMKGNDVIWMISPPLAANDNEADSVLLPFPEGWHASP